MKAQLQVNKAYIHLKDYGPRFEVIMGGAGSGKSYAIAQHVILSLFDSSHVGRNWLCVRKVAKTLRYSIFSLLRQILSDMNMLSLVSINKTDMTFEYCGRKIILMGLDDVEKLKSINGITDIWVEEATETTADDVQQLNLRLRGGTLKKRIILSFNPISSLHWLKGYFVDRVDESIRVTKTTYADNAFLDDDYKKELESYKTLDPYYYQVYALGEWGILGNVVFSKFHVENFNYKDDDFTDFCVGIDFGYVHASAIILCGFRDGKLYVIDELYGKGWTNTDFIEAAGDYFGDRIKGITITADSAEPDRIEEWERAGYRINPAKKGKGSLRYGIDYLIAQDIVIHGQNCPNLIREMQTFHRREDKGGNTLEEFVELNDDAIAALRYATEWIWSRSRGQIADAWSADDLGL